MATAEARIDYQEAERRFPEDSPRYELVDGELFVMGTPLLSHQDLVLRLYERFLPGVRAAKAGKLCLGPTGVLFSRYDMVQPDLFLVPQDQVASLRGRHVRCVPSLIVEVLSPSNRAHDEVRKRRLYEKHGVAEYWLVDREIEAVKVYRLVEGRYGRPVEYSRERGEKLATGLVPGVELDLAELFGGLPPDADD